jgi:hypothetical protein
MREPRTLIPLFATLHDKGITFNGLEVREILVLLHDNDEEIVEKIRLNLYKPGTPDGRPDDRFDALIEPRHRNSLLIEQAAFAALLKAEIIRPPHYWDDMRPVCQMIDFETAL